MKPPPPKTILFITLAACVAALLSWGCYEKFYRYRHGIIAIYDHFQFRGGGGHFDELAVFFYKNGYVKDEIPIYIEIPGGQHYLLQKLPESVAAQITESVYEDHGSTNYSLNVSSVLDYQKGRITIAIFRDSEILVSGHKDGPYYKLRLDLPTLVQEFGEPREWQAALPPKRLFMP